MAGSRVKIWSGTTGSCTLNPFPVLKNRPRASAGVDGAAGRCAGISAMLRGRSSPGIDGSLRHRHATIAARWQRVKVFRIMFGSDPPIRPDPRETPALMYRAA